MQICWPARVQNHYNKKLDTDKLTRSLDAMTTPVLASVQIMGMRGMGGRGAWGSIT